MHITAQEVFSRLLEGRELEHDETTALMHQIMRGEVSPVLIASILTALRIKRETVGEIVAAAEVLRDLSTKVHTPPYKNFVDIVGTGGDCTNSFNISTASMFVAAAAGAHVAKHGNRGVSSKCGSADVLEALGAAINLSPEQVAQCLEETGIGFMFAPNHHPSMKVVAPVRKEMGIRTLFNMLGPLSNPAGAPQFLMGVFHADLVAIMPHVLRKLGVQHALVVCGKDGMDEISLGAPTQVGELRDGEVFGYEIHPEEFGFGITSHHHLRVNDIGESKLRLLEALENRPGVARDIVALNAGAALYAANFCLSVSAGVELAREAIGSGAARAKLDQFVNTTRNIANRTLRWTTSFGTS